MSINKVFEKWVNRYVKENDNIDYDLIILEDMSAAWNASRINTLDEIKKKLLIYEDISSGDTLEALGYKQGLQRNNALKYIDTELNTE